MGCWLLASNGRRIACGSGRVPAEAIGFRAGQPKRTSIWMLRRNRPGIASRYGDGGLWSPAHFRCVGRRAPIIKQYVEQQRQRASSSP
jgi:REP element-mobilizing transposase RayT